MVLCNFIVDPLLPPVYVPLLPCRDFSVIYLANAYRLGLRLLVFRKESRCYHLVTGRSVEAPIATSSRGGSECTMRCYGGSGIEKGQQRAIEQAANSSKASKQEPEI